MSYVRSLKHCLIYCECQIFFFVNILGKVERVNLCSVCQMSPMTNHCFQMFRFVWENPTKEKCLGFVSILKQYHWTKKKNPASYIVVLRRWKRLFSLHTFKAQVLCYWLNNDYHFKCETQTLNGSLWETIVLKYLKLIRPWLQPMCKYQTEHLWKKKLPITWKNIVNLKCILSRKN